MTPEIVFAGLTMPNSRLALSAESLAWRLDHDGGAEFAADEPGGALERVGGPEDVADLVHGADAFETRAMHFSVPVLVQSAAQLAGAWPDMKRTMLSKLGHPLHGAGGLHRGLSGRFGELEAKFPFRGWSLALALRHP